jgi:hypothetical protein
MTSYQPYINNEEFAPVNKIKNCPEKVQALKAMAGAGNIQAAFAYGDMLMAGAWDIKRMELDLVRGQLLPSTTDVNMDTYLILPRNQYHAIEYLKIAANYPYENLCVEISKARAQLSYCRGKANIGYYNHGKLDKIMLELFYKPMENSAESQDKLANPFFPLPYVRPEVEDPKTKVFEHVASRMNINASLLTLLYHIFAFYAILPTFVFANGSINSGVSILVIEGFTLILYDVPIIILYIYKKIYGSKRPLCACPEIRKAYEASVADLPKELRQDDPFEGIPTFARNIVSIELSLNGFYAISAIIFAVLYFTNIFDITQLSKKFLSGGMIYSICFVTIAFSMMSTLFYKNMRKGFVDQICDHELFVLTEMSDQDAFFEAACKNN